MADTKPKKTTRKAKVEDQAPEVTETPDVEMEPVKLTIQDLSALATIIDAATTRGAFRAAELTQVGTVFDRLQTFLKQVAENQEEAGEAEAEAE